MPMDTSEDIERRSWVKGFHRKASKVHSRVLYLSKLPFSVVAIIVFLILVNIAAWVVAIIALVRSGRCGGEFTSLIMRREIIRTSSFTR